MEEQIARAFRQLEEWVGSGAVPGVSAAVWQRGRIVATFTAGLARRAPAPAPVRPDTRFAVASVTKPFTAAAALLLVDRGLVELDAPVRRYLPEFAGGGREAVTVRQLACHTGGLPARLPTNALSGSDRLDLAAISAAMLRLPLERPPGTRVVYSEVGPVLLAEIVRRVSGVPFHRFVQAELLAPLGLRATGFAPPADEEERIAHVAGVAEGAGPAAEPYNSAYWRDLGHPSSGLFATPSDLVRFAGVFLAAGAPLLRPETAAAMVRDQTGGLPGGLQGALEWPRCAWGLGWEVRGDKQPHWTGRRVGPQMFGHFGHAGALLWADPARRLAWAVCANQTMDSGWYKRRWPALCDALA